MTFKQLHKWLSLLVFTQLFIWLGTGFLLGASHGVAPSLKPVDLSIQASVRGAQNEARNDFFSLTELIQKHPNIVEVELIYLFDQAMYRAKINAGRHSYQASQFMLFDAFSAQAIDLAIQSPDVKALINRLALLSYKAPGASKSSAELINSTELLTPPIEDLPKERNPVWRVNINDAPQTSIYIRAQSAALITHVNEDIRWRNLLLMLHFMDYAQTGDFNNWFIRVFAILTFVLSGTGLWWIYRLIKQGQIRFTWFTGNKAVLVHHQGAQQSMMASGNSTLLLVLNEHNIDIQATCGGGGVCGTCIYRGKPDALITPADDLQLSEEQLALGYRLACQHLLREVSELSLND